MTAPKVVDAWAQQPTDRFMAEPWLSTLLRWTGRDRTTPSIDETLAAMDAARVEIALLSAWHGPQGPLISNDEVAEFVAAAPERFRGVASVDLTRPMHAMAEIRRCLEAFGFVAVRALPWLWGLPPDDRRFYPIYVACVEARVPFCTQVGHTGPQLASEPGRPIPYLDRVLLDFPELTVVGGHVGFPWVDEVISLATKYPNLYVDTSAYSPDRLPIPFVEWMRDRGRTRVLFGSNWPMIAPAHCLEGLPSLELDDEGSALFLGGNAERVFSLADGRGAAR